jgi:hypothetical protein
MVKLAASADHNKAIELLNVITPEVKKDVVADQKQDPAPTQSTQQLVSLADLTKAFQGNAPADEKATWNIYDWQANAPQELLKIMNEQPEKYDAIVKRSAK